MTKMHTCVEPQEPRAIRINFDPRLPDGRDSDEVTVRITSDRLRISAVGVQARSAKVEASTPFRSAGR